MTATTPVEGTSSVIENSINKFVFSLESQRKVEGILQFNPGNYERKKPITLGKNELETLSSIQRGSVVEEDFFDVLHTDG